MKRSTTLLRWSLLATIHIVCIAIYAIPVLLETQSSNPVLDEMHIVTDANRDVNGPTTLHTIWSNDYWGRPLDSPSSHKSWRPISILSFRYLQGGNSILHTTPLRIHRLVNILTHAAAAHMVGILTVQFYRPTGSTLRADLLRSLATLLFALHPTHVEVTANAANRPHLIAVLCAVLCASPSTHLILFLLGIPIGLLSCETFLFQLPAIAITHVLILSSKRTLRIRNVLQTCRTYAWTCLVPRWLYIGVCGLCYLWYRFTVTGLSIPDGLIRPAENPYYSLRGTVRIVSYTYTWAIHVTKQWAWELAVGMSHEYGYNCIPAFTSVDPRWWRLVGIVVLLHVLVVAGRTRSRSFWLYLTWSLASWIPVSGILKVGTFVSDRIVVAATVPVCMLLAVWMTEWWFCRVPRNTTGKPRWYRVGLSLGWLFLLYIRVHERSLHWMDSVPLLLSSLKTCPNFAKAHMEVSKVYSGLYPHLLDMKKARYHLQRAAEIDPDFCDVHYQLAFVALKTYQHQPGLNPIELEENLLKALQCPYTMGQALPMWQQYWQNLLQNHHGEGNAVLLAENQQRYEKYQLQIQQKIQEESEKETDTAASQQRHPFAWK